MVNGLDIGGHSGGAESFGIRLARELAKNGWAVTVCAFYQYNTQIEHKWEQILNAEQIDVMFIVPPGNRNYLYWLSQFFRQVINQRATIYHSHSHISTIFAIFYKFIGKVDCLVRTAHTPTEFGSGCIAGLTRLLFRDIIYPVMLQAEVGVSQNIVDQLNSRLVARLFGKKSTKIHNALPERDEITAQAGEVGSIFASDHPSSWRIASVGLLRFKKRFDILIQAMPIILQHIPHARLVLLGDGPVRVDLVDLANKLNISEHVSFLGQQAAVIGILKQCHVFVLPSVTEGLSTVTMEAMQAGLPVVASDIPGNRELIQNGHNGILCPPLDVNAFASAVLALYQNPSLVAVYVEQSRVVINRLNIAAITKDYLDIYHSCSKTPNSTFSD